MYIRGVILRNSTEFDEAVPIDVCLWSRVSYAGLWSVTFLGHSCYQILSFVGLTNDVETPLPLANLTMKYASTLELILLWMDSLFFSCYKLGIIY